jgi:hypothetical protein
MKIDILGKSNMHRSLERDIGKWPWKELGSEPRRFPWAPREAVSQTELPSTLVQVYVQSPLLLLISSIRPSVPRRVGPVNGLLVSIIRVYPRNILILPSFRMQQSSRTSRTYPPIRWCEIHSVRIRLHSGNARNMCFRIHGA